MRTRSILFSSKKDMTDRVGISGESSRTLRRRSVCINPKLLDWIMLDLYTPLSTIPYCSYSGGAENSECVESGEVRTGGSIV